MGYNKDRKLSEAFEDTPQKMFWQLEIWWELLFIERSFCTFNFASFILNFFIYENPEL